MSEQCKWLHEQLNNRPPPIDYDKLMVRDLPENGIYFFYENGETWGHGESLLRIVRIGTHTGHDNLRSRISEHYLPGEYQKRMKFGLDEIAPKDRSVFRKHIGRALLSRDGDAYLSLWNCDWTYPKVRKQYRDRRNIEKEKSIERKVTDILRQKFFFRFIILGDSKEERQEFEKRLIATVAQCSFCKPSDSWLGNNYERLRIRGLWLIDYAEGKDKRKYKYSSIDGTDRNKIVQAIETTKNWIKNHWQRGR